MTTFLGMPTAPRGVGHLRQTEPFPAAARRGLADTQMRRNLTKATGIIRAKRAAIVGNSRTGSSCARRGGRSKPTPWRTSTTTSSS